MYTFRHSDFHKLDLNIDRGIDSWHMHNYCFLSVLVDEDKVKQDKALTLCLSRETLALVHNLGLSEA